MDTSYSLPPAIASRISTRLQVWDASRATARLWAKDPSLWTGTDEANWLAWLDSPARYVSEAPRYAALREAARAEGFTDVVVLGMGGSSLAPWVLSEVYRAPSNGLRLRVLDSTDPVQIRTIESAVDLRTTLFILASKSGSTLEPNVLRDYFLDRVNAVTGNKGGRQFIAITDPGSQVEQHAKAQGYRAIFHGEPQIGGRFSALSPFGLVPAALIGIDLDRFLADAVSMSRACGGQTPADENPGVLLGTLLGTLALEGRDKLTLISGPPFDSLGAWLEQLVAESTGKDGRGIIPVSGELLGAPSVYGTDRVFVYTRVAALADAGLDRRVDALEQAGHPVIRINAASAQALGAEFYRWEMATAVAGAHLGVNPFNQPDVEDAKVLTRQLVEEYERSGVLPADRPIAEEAELRAYADPGNEAALTRTHGIHPVVTLLKAHFGRIRPGDYFAVLAYLPMIPSVERQIGQLRELVLERCRVATSVGFGPRFQHSTGQAYKGGPDSGVFLQVTCDDGPRDLAVPGHRYTFGIVKAAQARGDFGALAARGRRLLRIHLGEDVERGLESLTELVRQALA